MRALKTGRKWRGWRVTARLAGMMVAGVLGATLFAQAIRVTPIARDGRVLVSFELADGFTDEIRAAIHSGLPTTFSYEIELRRASPIWFDKTIASARVSATVRYDNLTRRYQVSRLLDGRVEEADVTEEEAVVARRLTAFERLPLFNTSPLEANAEYYVRVRARTRPRNSWFFWPWDGAAASATAKFTFIP